MKRLAAASMAVAGGVLAACTGRSIFVDGAVCGPGTYETGGECLPDPSTADASASLDASFGDVSVAHPDAVVPPAESGPPDERDGGALDALPPTEDDASPIADSGQAGNDAAIDADAAEAAADATDGEGGCGAPVPSGSRAVAYQIDTQHTGAQPGDSLALPLCPRWATTLPGSISYPLIVDGQVFVTVVSASGGKPSLYALDATSGQTTWGPVALGGTYGWGNAAYDGGRIFAVNTDCLLAAFDASTGTQVWSVALPGQYSCSSAPTAYDGIVYTGGAGSGGTVYAVDENVGTVLWTATVENGDTSSPAVAASGVYVSYACNQAYGFDPVSGASLWHFNGPCEGGGGKTAVLFGGALYTRDAIEGDLILSAASGTQTGTYQATPAPAFSMGQTFRLSAGTLRAYSLTTGSAAWSFAGDGALQTAPLVVGSDVVIGSGSGTINVVDAASGQVVSSANVGAPIPAPDEQNVSQPLTGLAEADGLLVVPAGSRLVAY